MCTRARLNLGSLSSEHACFQFGLNPLSICLFRVSAGRWPTPASPPTQMTQPRKSPGDSQTVHPEGLRYLRSVARRNFQTLTNQTGIVEILSRKVGEKTQALKTDSKHLPTKIEN